jgi:AcrR family transcriptional regulator
MGVKERRAREKKERYNLILSSARTLLFKKGLAGTSINQIAKVAEIGASTIYSYFKSKEEIFAALQQEGLEVLHYTINSFIKKDDNAEEKLRKIGRAYFEFSQKNKNYFDVINYFLSAPEAIFAPNLKKQIDQHGNKNLNMIVKAIEKGIEDEIFKNINSRRYAILMWSTMHGMINLKKLENTILENDNFEDLYFFAVNQIVDNLIKLPT